MATLLSWVKQILLFYIFSNFILHLLPSGNYEKYVKFFVGIILIVIVIGPFTGILNLDQVFETMYEAAINNDEIKNMKIDLKYAQEDNYESIVSPYREEIIEKIDNIVMENNLYPAKTSVEFDLNSESNNFGSIEKITVHVSKKYTSDNKVAIDKIKVDKINSQNNTDGEESNLSVSALNIKSSIVNFFEISHEKVIVIE